MRGIAEVLISVVMGDLISTPECDGAKAHVPISSKLAFGVVAGIVTALLTIVMGVIPAIAIGGIGVGIALRLYLRMRANRCVARLGRG
jgi:hypothetical protein